MATYKTTTELAIALGISRVHANRIMPDLVASGELKATRLPTGKSRWRINRASFERFVKAATP